MQRLDLDGEDAKRYFRKKQEIQDRLSKLIPTREISAKVLSGEVDIDDLSDREDLVNIQDNVTQMGQGVIADRENERLGPADSAIILLRKIWRRELEALAKGSPPTQWEIPERIGTTSGVGS